MRRVAAMTAAVAMVVFASSVSAQAPSLVGKWTLQVDPAAAPPAGGGGGRGGGRGGGGGQFCGMECTIEQTATTLTIKRTTQAGETSTAYTLDGKEGKITQQGQNGPTEIKYTATVAGGKITISTTRDVQGTPVTSKVVVGLDAGKLVVESTAAPRGGGDPVTTKQTYTKS